MSESNNIEDIISSDNQGYSNILRNAREQKGMSLEDVGTKLCLDEKIIYAIESNDSESLPEPAYVCGYIRNYARLMLLDPAPLVDSFKQTTSLKTELNSVTSVTQVLDKKESNRSIYFIIFLVLLLLFGVFFGWQLWQEKAVALFSFNQNETTGEIKDSSLLSLTHSKNTSSEADNTGISLAFNNKQNITQENTDNIELLSSSNLDKELDNELDKKLDNEPVSIEVKIDDKNTILAENTQSDGSEVQQQINEKNKQIPKGKKQLEFTFSKNSWISVKDGNTKSLIYDLVHKGEVITLYGKAPVNIFLGDGTGVELSVDGQSYSFASYINKKNIAKFVVE